MTVTDQDQSVNREKFEAINRLLDQEYILVHVSTSSEGLALPEYLKEQSVVTLKLSRWFRGGMDVSQERISADLLFDNNYFTCLIPLPAVWGVTSSKGENLVWPKSMPPQLMSSIVAAQVESQPEMKKEPAPQPAARPKRPSHLKRIK